MARTETFSAVCSKVGNFSYANNFTLYVILTDRDGNPSTNKSFVDYNVYCQSNGSGSINANHHLYFSLNNNQIRNETTKVNVSSPYAYIHIASGTLEVSHESVSSIPFYAEIRGSTYGVAASVSGNFNLEYIPRYSEINSVSVQSTGVNTAIIQFSVSRPADIYYSVDNEGWQGPVLYNTTSGIFNIVGISPNTNHAFRILTKAVDSKLDRISNYFYGTTKDIARIKESSNFNIGDTPSITYSEAPEGCTLRASIERITEEGGERIEDISAPKDVTGTSCSFEYDINELYSKIPNSNNGWCRYCLITICNGYKYWSTSDKQFFVTNSNPIFSNFSYKDINSEIVNNITGNDQTIIKNYSNVEGTINVSNKAIAQNSATMSKYRLSIGDKIAEADYSENSDVVISINKVTSNTFTMYAIDSRNNSTSKQLTAATYIEYEPIKITSIKVTRTNNVESETTLNFSGYIWDGNFGKVINEIKRCYYKYKKTTDIEWNDNEIEINPIKDETRFSFNEVISGDLGAIGFDIDESYDIQVFIEDKLSNNYDNPSSFILGPGLPAIAIYKNNVAIGQKYDLDDPSKFQVAGDVNFKGNIIGPVFDGINNKINGYILYDNESGSTGTIYLSEDIEGFNGIEIFYGKDTLSMQSVKMYAPEKKGLVLVTGYVENETSAQIQLPIVVPFNKFINKNTTGLINFGTNTVNIFTSNEVRIYRVVGYK